MPITMPKKPKEFWPYFSLAIVLVGVGINLATSQYPFVGVAGAIIAIAVPLSATEEWKTGARFISYIASMSALGLLFGAFALGFRFSWVEGTPVAWLFACVAAIAAAITHWLRTWLQDSRRNEEPSVTTSQDASECKCECTCGAGRSSTAAE